MLRCSIKDGAATLKNLQAKQAFARNTWTTSPRQGAVLYGEGRRQADR